MCMCLSGKYYIVSIVNNVTTVTIATIVIIVSNVQYF